MRPVHQLLALLVVVLWGVNFLFIDFGLRDWPPLLLVAARFTFVVIPAILFVKYPRGRFGRILLIGVFMSAGQFSLLYTSLFLGMPVGLSSIVLQIQAVFTVVVAALALREVPSRRQILGVLIGLSGLAVIALSLEPRRRSSRSSSASPRRCPGASATSSPAGWAPASTDCR